MKKRKLIPLCFSSLLVGSCSPRSIVFITPGKYLLEEGPTDNAVHITKDSYFVATLTEVSIQKGETRSFYDEKKSMNDVGHWYLCGGEYEFDLSWKNCDFETMPSFYQGGVDEDAMLLWSEEMKNIEIEFLGMKKNESCYSVKIDCYDRDEKKNTTFVFAQSV
ncbi:MAG: hypothetical protein K6G74_03090 [Bacilli bacterium]|nr:hypothetical protein [Bacilli bacterium]